MTSPEKFDSNKAAGQEGSVENPIVPVGKTFSKEELFKYLSDVLKRPITTLRDLVNPEIRDDLQQAFGGLQQKTIELTSLYGKKWHAKD
jgi:hypothetical protein